MKKTIEDYRQLLQELEIKILKRHGISDPLLHGIYELLEADYEKPKKRKPVSISSCVVDKELVRTAICNDGTIWERSLGCGDWGRVREIPQDEE